MKIHDKIIKLKSGPVRETTPFLLTLLELVVEMKPEVIVEIGLHNGYAAHAFLAGLAENKKGMLYSVDLIDFSDNIKDPELKKYLNFTKADSREFYKTFDKTIDILHIDGDHSYTVCKADYENYYPMVRPGGYILIHDVIHWKGCTKFWEEIKDNKIFLPWFDGMGIVQKSGLTPLDVANTRNNLAGK
jgi:predicted O-methyltransferase YrrM